MVVVLMREELKSASMKLGEQSVLVVRTIIMLLLSVARTFTFRFEFKNLFNNDLPVLEI